jgi:UPF0755 protein
MTKRSRTSPRTGTRRVRSPRRSPWLGAALIGCGSLALLCCLAVAFVLLPGPLRDRPVSFYVARDMPLPELSEHLANAGLIRQPWLFTLYLKLSGQANAVVSGAHFIKPGVNPRSLAWSLTRSQRRPKVSVTIPEGFDQFRVASRLQSLGVCSASDFLAASSSTSLLSELSIDGPSAEGYLFPLTYRLLGDTDPKELIALWVDETRRRLQTISDAYNRGLLRLKEQRGWGEHELLTLASMIEKESNRDDERRTIAGVFFNRLDDQDFRPRRMLQSDPTAYYGCVVAANRYPGCEGNPGHVVAAMLRDSQNPYNTYRHAGLPPGPISNPGAASIAAVMDPEQSDYLFFVAKNGRHVFSKTLSEHEAKTHRLE